MAQVTLKGSPINTAGNLPSVGSKIPAFVLVKNDLSEISQKDLAGSKFVLNVFPSIDTPVCALTVRAFNAMASKAQGAKVLCISQDLPFASARFCGAEGLEEVISASAFRNQDFGKVFGMVMTDGPLRGLLARSVIIVDAQGVVIHSQLVPEITQEPDYEAALKALS
ncbi:MAG: thiol peroxidase [Holophagaceae bacterium]|nr:thiol peroxidase [Holophagaceae bacterium]